jgi:hypothetical protein
MGEKRTAYTLLVVKPGLDGRVVLKWLIKK